MLRVMRRKTKVVVRPLDTKGFDIPMELPGSVERALVQFDDYTEEFIRREALGRFTRTGQANPYTDIKIEVHDWMREEDRKWAACWLLDYICATKKAALIALKSGLVMEFDL